MGSITILILFGLFLFFIILEIGLRIGGFVLLSMQEHRNRASISKRGFYRIMCLGESTTQRQYPPYLEEMLNQHNLGIRFSVIDEGMVGTNTPSILAQLESNLDKYQPDMVVTMMGINDEGDQVPYEATYNSVAIRFFRSFRVYKLTRLLWLHITTKAKEIGLLGPSKGRKLTVRKLQPNLKEVLFKKAIELNPKNEEAYIGLGEVYQTKGEFSQAEELFKKAVELDPYYDRIYGMLAFLYKQIDKPELAREYEEKAERIRLEYYNPITINSYRELKNILDKRDIRLVCVQYPMRNLEPLRKMFRSDEEGIIFVDNEKIFKDALKKASYKEYFNDMFAGNFGHCTKKGNRLLAENIANMILKKIFGK
jgi:tetratricopeptide (TPR) repeat protein